MARAPGIRVSGIRIDYADWKRQIVRLARIYGLDVAELMREEHGRLIRDCMASTPPFSSRKLFGENVAPGQQVGLALGRAAIAGDLNKIFVPMEPGLFDFFKQLYKDFPESFTDEKSVMKEFHEKHRNKKGRVHLRYYQKTKTRADFKLLNKLHVPEALFKQYLKERQEKVGRMKAGWNAAAFAFGLKVPGWINKKGTAEGKTYGSINKSGNGKFTAVNSVPYNEDYGLSRLINAAVRNRQRQLPRYLKKRIEAISKKWQRETRRTAA